MAAGTGSCAGLTDLGFQDAPSHARRLLLATSARSARAVNDNFCRSPLQLGSERECPKSEYSRRSMQKLEAFLWVSFRNPSRFWYILLIQKVTKSSLHSSIGELNTMSWCEAERVYRERRKGWPGQPSWKLCFIAPYLEIAVPSGILDHGTCLKTTSLKFIFNFK